MDRETKQEIHEYCKNRERRKNRYANKMKDKQKNNRENDFFFEAHATKRRIL